MPSSAVISAVVSALKSKSKYNQIISLCPHITPTEFSLITLSLRSTPRVALSFFHITLRHSLTIHSLSSLSTLIHTLSRSRSQTLKPQILTLIQSALTKFPDPIALFRSLSESYTVCDSAPCVFGYLLESCLISNKIDEAIEIFRISRKKGLPSNAYTCDLLIESVFKHRGSLSGYGFYKEIFSFGDRRVKGPGIRTFNSIMLGFYRDGFGEFLGVVSGEMVKRGVEIDTRCYRVLLAYYCEDGKLGEATKLWEEMVELKCNTIAYNTMIGGYCGMGEMDRAEEFFQEMEMSGIEGTCVTFEHLVKGYCKIGDLDSALLLYKDMCSRGFRPESFVVDAIVRGLCEKEKRVFEGLEFLRSAMRKYEILPKWTSYEVLVNGLCYEGKVEEARDLQEEMVGKGFEPNLEIYRAFIDGYAKNGNDEMAKRVEKEMMDTREIGEEH